MSDDQTPEEAIDRMMADAGLDDMAPAHEMLASLSRIGWALVKLPEGDELDELLSDNGIRVSSVALGLPISTGDEFGRTHRSIRSARDFAGALLVAAALAEEAR